jgi:hypothetical protein
VCVCVCVYACMRVSCVCVCMYVGCKGICLKRYKSWLYVHQDMSTGNSDL